jgi:hypothetical protein
MWRGPIEIAAVRVGEVLMFVNPALERAYKFMLTCHETQVYRLEVSEGVCRHSNPANRPSSFPAKVVTPNHEHVYVEGLDCRCARPVDALDTSDHRAIFNWFCNRTCVHIDPDYSAPSLPFQMPML